ncbi:MAG: hypothetical protein HY744_12260 [Deltaproteobacteria bacterium]|nr:hypothetical protein [Deltaproteobacteria bacterium]
MALRAAATLVGLAGLLCAPALLASPQEVLGFGHRSMGMGTTGAAVGEGVDTVYANPALLSASHDLALQLGLVGAAFDLRAAGVGGPASISYPPLRANTIGGLLPLPLGGLLADRVTLGLGFLTPFDVIVRGRILYPERPQFLVADRVQSVAVQAALGADLGYGVRVGGGFMALAALSGSVLVATDASGRVGTRVEDTLVASYAPIVGASYELGRGYRVGLVFRGELVARFNVVIVAEDLGQITIPPLNISGVAQYDPWQIGIEAARVAGPWRLAVGATYESWGAYPGPLEATVRCQDAAEPDTPCSAPVPPDPGYHDTVSPRLGLERRLALAPAASLRLRAGYALEPSPAPPQGGAHNYFDCTRSVLTLGWGAALGRPPAPLELDGFAQAHVLHPRTHEKRVASGAPTDGEVVSSGFVFAGGAAATVRF